MLYFSEEKSLFVNQHIINYGYEHLFIKKAL